MSQSKKNTDFMSQTKIMSGIYFNLKELWTKFVKFLHSKEDFPINFLERCYFYGVQEKVDTNFVEGSEIWVSFLTSLGMGGQTSPLPDLKIALKNLGTENPRSLGI